MDERPIEGDYRMPHNFGKDWPNIRGMSLNEIVELTGNAGLLMLHQVTVWQKVRPDVKAALQKFLALPRISALLELAQEEERIDKIEARKAAARSKPRQGPTHAERERQMEMGW